MNTTRERLLKKGWSEEEIVQAFSIFDRVKQKTHPKIRFLNKIVYWFALFVIILGNIAFSVIPIPLLLTLNNISLYIIILLLASCFGILMSIVIKDLENLETRHHLALYLIVPFVGLINFFIVVNIANKNVVANILQISHNPIIVSVIYFIGFLIPYTYVVFEEKFNY